MKCSVCFKAEDLSPQNDNPVHKGKQQEISHLQQRINLQRINYNQTLETKFGNNSIQNIKENQRTLATESASNFLSQLAHKIASKQNTLAEIKSLRQKISEKKNLIERCKKQRNQKLTLLQKAQNQFKKVKVQALQQSNQQITEIKEEIKRKNEKNAQNNKKVKKHFKQTLEKDFGSILSIHRMFRLRESEKLFQIKKMDELDFRNSEQMMQSFYEVENIEEMIIKAKSSQKGIHIMLQNVVILQLVEKICGLWLPFPIQSQINLTLSRLVGKHSNIRIGGRKLIDYCKTQEISNKVVVQFFDQSIRQPVQIEESVKRQEPVFQDIKPQFDESIEYNKRNYALSRDFISFMQLNVEFLSMKFGIDKRPMVFFESDLMKAIQKQLLWRLSLVQSLNGKPCPSQYYDQGYGSMLRELKASKLIESLENMHSMKMTQEYAESNKTIPEVVEGESQGEQKQKPREGSQLESFFWGCYTSLSKRLNYEQTTNDPEVPQSLQNVRSNQSQNDEFQPLEPESD